MRYLFLSLMVLGAVPGCTQLAKLRPVGDAPDRVVQSDQARPVVRPDTLNTHAQPVSTTARTVEEFDTTTAQQRTAAVAQARDKAGARDIGLTIASLGAVTEPGFWLKTPLVSAPSKGRVEYGAKGTSVVVDLIPLEGERGAGSRLSLAAFRLLDAPLTGLPTVRVFQLVQ